MRHTRKHKKRPLHPEEDHLAEGEIGAVASGATMGTAVGAAAGLPAGLPGMAVGAALGGAAGALIAEATIETKEKHNPSRKGGSSI